MSQKAAFDDANIPVLTEVVLEKAAAAPAAPEPVPAAEPDWSELESRIAERAMQQLQDPMALVLDEALAGVAAQLRTGLLQAIKAAVAHAVAEEIARLKPHVTD